LLVVETRLTKVVRMNWIDNLKEELGDSDIDFTNESTILYGIFKNVTYPEVLQSFYNCLPSNPLLFLDNSELEWTSKPRRGLLH
jgi:hypothetical protein